MCIPEMMDTITSAVAQILHPAAHPLQSAAMRVWCFVVTWDWATAEAMSLTELELTSSTLLACACEGGNLAGY